MEPLPPDAERDPPPHPPARPPTPAPPASPLPSASALPFQVRAELRWLYVQARKLPLPPQSVVRKGVRSGPIAEREREREREKDMEIESMKEKLKALLVATNTDA